MATTTTSSTRPTDLDPIDALVPPPQPTWVRLAIGTAIAAVVGTLAFLWGFGYLTPRPDCCGNGGGSAIMSLSPDGQAVTVTASLFNSSGRDIVIESATAELPGAEVVDIALLDPDNNVYPTGNVHPLPARLAAHEMSRLLITLVPTSCSDNGEPWGTVTADLSVADSWFPTFGRSYELPDPVVPTAANELVVLGPEFLDDVAGLTTPLVAACALLQR